MRPTTLPSASTSYSSSCHLAVWAGELGAFEDEPGHLTAVFLGAEGFLPAKALCSEPFCALNGEATKASTRVRPRPIRSPRTNQGWGGRLPKTKPRGGAGFCGF